MNFTGYLRNIFKGNCSSISTWKLDEYLEVNSKSQTNSCNLIYLGIGRITPSLLINILLHIKSVLSKIQAQIDRGSLFLDYSRGPNENSLHILETYECKKRLIIPKVKAFPLKCQFWNVVCDAFEYTSQWQFEANLIIDHFNCQETWKRLGLKWMINSCAFHFSLILYHSVKPVNHFRGTKTLIAVFTKNNESIDDKFDTLLFGLNCTYYVGKIGKWP